MLWIDLPDIEEKAENFYGVSGVLGIRKLIRAIAVIVMALKSSDFQHIENLKQAVAGENGGMI